MTRCWVRNLDRFDLLEELWIQRKGARIGHGVLGDVYGVEDILDEIVRGHISGFGFVGND